MNTSKQSENAKPTPIKNTRRSKSQWRELIESFGQSHLSVEAFCRQQKIAASNFYAWRKRLECEAKENSL